MIALLGGTSWPSTIEYYKRFNELAETTLGPGHSAELLLRSVDYHDVRANYSTDWTFVQDFLRKSLVELDGYDPKAIVICNNTLHKAYDQLTDLELTNPVVHIVDAVAEQTKQKELRNLLLLGTQFTLEDGFYQRRLESHGFGVQLPSASEITEIQRIQTLVSQGKMEQEFFDSFFTLLNKYTHLDGVVLACTELPLVVKNDEAPFPVISSIEAHVAVAWELIS